MQIFIQAKILGIQEFLLAPPASPGSDPSRLFTGRSHWVALVSEVLPRALLAELGLSRLLLGSSGGGRFLLVLPEESRERAEEFLRTSAAGIEAISAGAIRLTWAITEDLGGWSEIRKRLRSGLFRQRDTPATQAGITMFRQPVSIPSADAEAYFSGPMGFALRETKAVKWHAESGRVEPAGEADPQQFQWPLATGAEAADAIPLARHSAPNQVGSGSASMPTLATRAAGTRAWGVLRGDVDQMAARLMGTESADEHIRVSGMFKQFFAGEVEMLCSAPEYWKKVSVIYSGGDDFAIYGAWDALIGMAVEMERLFRRFVNFGLTDASGLEGKTITMAIALASTREASLGAVFEEAGQHLEAAKSAGKDSIWLLGRRLEWKQFAEAEQLKDALARMTTEFGCAPQYLNDLCGLYRESRSRMSKRQLRQSGGERPWRYHRRIRRILHAARGSSDGVGFQKSRSVLIASLIGRSAAAVKLRPSGRVALEWARLAASR